MAKKSALESGHSVSGSVTTKDGRAAAAPAASTADGHGSSMMFSQHVENGQPCKVNEDYYSQTDWIVKDVGGCESSPICPPHPTQSAQGDLLLQGRVDDRGQLEITFQDGDKSRRCTMPVAWMLEFLNRGSIATPGSSQDSLGMTFGSVSLHSKINMSSQPNSVEHLFSAPMTHQHSEIDSQGLISPASSRRSSTENNSTADFNAIQTAENAAVMQADLARAAKKRRDFSTEADFATSSSSADETEATNSQDPLILEQSMVSFAISDEDTVRMVYETIFTRVQQAAMKNILKAWIKEIEPRKQRKWPYCLSTKLDKDAKVNTPNGKLQPPWWPKGVKHVEPDHLGKRGRHRLGHAIIRYVQTDPYKKFSNQGIQRLRKAADTTNLNFEPEPMEKYQHRMDLLNQLYGIALKQKMYREGCIDPEEQCVVENLKHAARNPRQWKKKRRVSNVDGSDDLDMDRMDISAGQEVGVALIPNDNVGQVAGPFGHGLPPSSSPQDYFATQAGSSPFSQVVNSGIEWQTMRVPQNSGISEDTAATLASLSFSTTYSNVNDYTTPQQATSQLTRVVQSMPNGLPLITSTPMAHVERSSNSLLFAPSSNVPSAYDAPSGMQWMTTASANNNSSTFDF